MTQHLLYFDPTSGRLSDEGAALCADALLEDALHELPDAVRHHLDVNSADAARVLALASLWSQMAQEAARAYDSQAPAAGPDPLQPLFQQPRAADTWAETPSLQMPFWRRYGMALAAAATILLIAVSGYWFVFRNLAQQMPVAESLQASKQELLDDSGIAAAAPLPLADGAATPQLATASPAPTAAQIAQDELAFGDRFADLSTSQPAARTAATPVAKSIAGLVLDSAQISPANNANLLHPVRFSVPLRGGIAALKHPLHIEIRDNLGRLVYTSPSLDSTNFTLPKQLPPGLYFWDLVAQVDNQPATVVYQGRFRLYRTLARDGANYNP